MELTFTNLLIVVAIGFAAPLALGFVPAVRAPVGRDRDRARDRRGARGARAGSTSTTPCRSSSTVGLAFLLFLAGLEIDFDAPARRVLRLTLLGFAVSFVLAIVVGLVAEGGRAGQQPLFVAIVLSATSLGVLVPVLKDAGEISSTFGQLVIAAGSIADFGTVILLSLFFSRESGCTASKVILLGGLFVVAVLIA